MRFIMHSCHFGLSFTDLIPSRCVGYSPSARDVNEARTLEAEARTLEAEARTLEAEARTFEAKTEATADIIQFWPSEFYKFRRPLNKNHENSFKM